MAFCLKCCGGKFASRSGGEKKNNTWRIFSLKELLAATNNFNYDNKLGEGGLGSVYWGQLWDGSQIVVKRLKVWSTIADVEFAVEVEVLGRVRHKYLLTIRGYCDEGQERLIVYNYMPNLSLLSHLHGQHSTECLLDWSKRMKIATGSAEALAYLHQHTPHIIHGDIKASNVLLSSDFEAQVADFGFSDFIPDDDSQATTRVKGQLGYLAPECATLGRASEASDVFGFGVLLLELASGRKPIDKISASEKSSVIDWALPLVCEKRYDELADPKLNQKYNQEELKRVVLVALVCAQNRPEQRPTMLEVVDLLKVQQKDKLSNLENRDLFKHGASRFAGKDEVANVMSDERNTKQAAEQGAVHMSDS